MPPSGPDRRAAGPGGLDERAADSVMRAVDLVEDRMGECLGVRDMADAACYSPFYFSRLFARATGHAPYDYLMRRRVAASADEVATGSRSIIDIALAFGFEVPDTFARAFRRCFGLLPSEARRDGSYPRSIARTPIERPYVEALLAEGPPIPDQVESASAVVEGAWLGRAEGVMPARGGVAIVGRDGELRPERSFLGSYAPADRGSAPPAYPAAATSIAGGRRARFRIGRPDRLGLAVEYAYRAWLPSAGRARPCGFDIVAADEAGNLTLYLPLDRDADSALELPPSAG
jgi:AraC-like DNA-binding protein